MNELKIYDQTRKTQIQSTVFADGMVVNAGDLDTAMRYPIDLWQTLVRAYFGCGIVCGLEVHRDPKGAEKTYCVSIEPGVALDCHGHPLRLCDSEKIDLTPDPCATEPWPDCVCIAIRRDTIPEAPRKEDDCEEDGKSSCQYAREREMVRIKVFKCDDLPKTLCALPEASVAKSASEEQPGLCECLKTCPDWNCCGDAWVLLACVTIYKDECNVTVDNTRRKYIKPVKCLCNWEEVVNDSVDKLDERLTDIENLLKEQVAQATNTQQASRTTSQNKGKTAKAAK
jgi:hypothetical protein